MQSTVIKKSEAGPILKRLSTVDLADHLAEAHSVVESARRRAADIVIQAEAKAKELFAKASKSGHEEGYKKGFVGGAEEGKQTAFDEAMNLFTREHAGIVETLRSAVDGIEAEKDDLMIAAQKDLLDFAVMVASRLTFKVGIAHSQSAVENLKRALRCVEAPTNLKIHVHPQDIASIETFARSVLENLGESRVFDIQPDESMAPGGCRVLSDRSCVDASLETQVDELLSLLVTEKPSDG